MAKVFVSAAQKRIDMIALFTKAIVDIVQNQRSLDMLWLSLRCDVHHDGSANIDKIYQEMVSGFMTMLIQHHLENKVQDDGTTITIWKSTGKVFCDDSVDALVEALGIR